jgi:hypothetical protein
MALRRTWENGTRIWNHKMMYKTCNKFEDSGILSTIYTVKHTECMLGGHSVGMRIILNSLKTVMIAVYRVSLEKLCEGGN